MSLKLLSISLLMILCAGCSQPAAPHSQAASVPALPGPQWPISTGGDQTFKVEIEPKVALAVWVLQPAVGTPIRGTILMLHGFATDHGSLANVGESLRKSGYRAVLVDLRGFGESTGVHSDFGVTDAHDMVQVVNALQAKGLCGATLGVYGTSLGAATGILMAGEDPRVVAVVAVASFADIRSEVPNFARGVLGSLGNVFADQDLNSFANVVSKAVNWNLDNARPVDAITQTKAQVLLIHGDADTYIPHADSEALHAAAPTHSQLITAHNHGHIDLCFNLPDDLQNATRDWFDRNLMPGGGTP